MIAPTLWVVYLPNPNGAGLILDHSRRYAQAWTRKDDVVEWARSHGISKAYFAPMKVAIPWAVSAQDDGSLPPPSEMTRPSLAPEKETP